MAQAKKGDFVQIHNIVLKASERAAAVPEDTKAHPLEMWVKGFALTDGKVGEELEVETMTGRRVKGTLVSTDPGYKHSFGSFVPELEQISRQLRNMELR